MKIKLLRHFALFVFYQLYVVQRDVNFISFLLKQSFFLFVWVDALRPWSSAEVMSGRLVSLFTLFLGKPPRGR